MNTDSFHVLSLFIGKPSIETGGVASDLDGRDRMRKAATSWPPTKVAPAIVRAAAEQELAAVSCPMRCAVGALSIPLRGMALSGRCNQNESAAGHWD
jgi:hypothetical protein